MYSQKVQTVWNGFLSPKMKPVAQNNTMTKAVIQTLPLIEPRAFPMAVMTAT